MPARFISALEGNAEEVTVTPNHTTRTGGPEMVKRQQKIERRDR
jgi:hypothetical protein